MKIKRVSGTEYHIDMATSDAIIVSKNQSWTVVIYVDRKVESQSKYVAFKAALDRVFQWYEEGK